MKNSLLIRHRSHSEETIRQRRDVIFTDLDGTLLDAETYSWQAARPALERLKHSGTPWILVTGKTRAEVEFWRDRLDHQHPFIVENGGAAFVPQGYFPQPVPGAARFARYEVIQWGTGYEALVADLDQCSQRSRCRVWGFHEMTPHEIAAACDFSLEQAILAKQREYAEPFLVRDPQRTGQLTRAIEERQRRWTRGRRFWHILGANDRMAAVLALYSLFERYYGPIRTIGFGDTAGDASFLDTLDVPVVVRSSHEMTLKSQVPRGLMTRRIGPAGWNEAILALLGG
jgi:mannosyl-3-phosphoglycerate phosphatase